MDDACVKLLKEKSKLIQQNNSLVYSRNHYYKILHSMPVIINKLNACLDTKEMIKPLVHIVSKLYGNLNIAIFNDNKEPISNSSANSPLIHLINSIDLNSLLNDKPFLQTVNNDNSSMIKEAVYYKGVVKYNNIIYYYILIERNSVLATYEIETLNNILSIYSSIYTSKIMLEYLSKLVITSTDAINFDPKTKTYSARSLQNDYVKLEETPHTYIFMDLDKFKSVNDSYGHDVGDIVLIKFAEHLMNCAKKLKGKAYRYGGEEFIIIVPGEISAIYDEIDTVRLEFASEVFKTGDTTFSVTVSSGIYRGKNGESALDCIKKADTLLYNAKNTGRNKICCE